MPPMQAQQFDVESVARDLVRVREIDGSFFVNLPACYPDGSCVTVKVDKTAGGIRVSDAGFAYREADDLDAGRLFTRTANRVAEETGVTVANKAIFVDADIGSLERAICDVAETSWRVASAISARVFGRCTDTGCLSRAAPPASKSGASTNFAIAATEGEGQSLALPVLV